MATDRLLIFAAAPRAGRVRRTLSPPLPADEAARVHEACLHDVVHLAARERGRVELWYRDADGARRYFDDWFPHVERRPLPSGERAHRLRSAFARSFDDGARRVLVLGARTPALPARAVTAAFDALREADAVLGPIGIDDCYLVGLRERAWPAAANLFNAPLDADDPAVPAAFRRAARAGLAARMLPGGYAVDRPADLRRARADLPADSNLGRWLAAPRARRYIGA